MHHMNTQDTIAKLAESSNLLLGLGRPLSKVETEPQPITQQSPVPGLVSPFGETTREKRNIVQGDAGYAYSAQRFASEVQFVPLPLCENNDIFGSSSRLIGRQPMMKKM